MNESPLLTKAQAAAYLNTTERHVQGLWDTRRLAATKVGRLVRFHKEDLDSFINRNRKAPNNA